MQLLVQVLPFLEDPQDASTAPARRVIKISNFFFIDDYLSIEVPYRQAKRIEESLKRTIVSPVKKKILLAIDSLAALASCSYARSITSEEAIDLLDSMSEKASLKEDGYAVTILADAGSLTFQEYTIKNAESVIKYNQSEYYCYQYYKGTYEGNDFLFEEWDYLNGNPITYYSCIRYNYVDQEGNKVKKAYRKQVDEPSVYTLDAKCGNILMNIKDHYKNSFSKVKERMEDEEGQYLSASRDNLEVRLDGYTAKFEKGLISSTSETAEEGNVTNTTYKWDAVDISYPNLDYYPLTND